MSSSTRSRIPPKPFSLADLKVGETLSYEADTMRVHCSVVAVDEDRHLPVVEVSASQVEVPGYEIVGKVNGMGLRGVLLGSFDIDTHTLATPGVIQFGREPNWVALETGFDGEIQTSLLPPPRVSLTQLEVTYVDDPGL